MCFLFRAPNGLTRLSLLFAVFLSMVFSCADENNFSIDGKVYYKQDPVVDAVIRIDGAATISAVSDEDGWFKISRIEQGIHILTVTKFHDAESFSQKHYHVDLQAALSLSALNIPGALSLEAFLHSGSSNIVLIWTVSDDEDFEGYEVYRYDLINPDGQKIYSVNDRTITTFVDVSEKGKGLYRYQVYTIDKFGKTAATNVESVEVK